MNGEENASAAIVNYGTPELTRMAVWSLHSLYPGLPITVVEGGSPDDSLERLRALQREIPQLRVMPCDENVHHGPGLDRAIRASTCEWVLTFDSDCIAYRSGFLGAMLDAAEAQSAYMVGSLRTVSSTGHDVEAAGHPYVHPKCALVRRATYTSLPPFDKHGAPCLANAVAARKQACALVDFPVEKYVFHRGRGTVDRFGYGLGARGWLGKLRRRIRRLTGRGRG